MDYYKKLLKIFISNVKRTEKKYLVAISLFSIYVVCRPRLLFFYLLSLILAVLFIYFKDNYSDKQVRIIKFTFYVICILISTNLIISSSNYIRVGSWDGQLWYLKRVLSLRKDFFLDFTDSPHPAYLIELVLSFLWKYTSEGYVYRSFIIVSFINIYLILVFYEKMGFSNFKSRYLAYIICTSPVYLGLAMFQFKIEPFLLMFCLCSFIFFKESEKRADTLSYILFGIFSGLAVLTKISVFPFYVFLISSNSLCLILYKKYTRFWKSLIPCIVIAIMVSSWVNKYGVGVPWTNINFYPRGLGPSVVFERNADIFNKCLSEQKIVDFSQFINDRNLRDIIIQPINYLLDINSLISTFSLVDPGVYFYFSVILYIPLVLRKKIYKNPLMLAAFLYTIYFFISIRTIYWYLFFLFPMYSVPIYDYLLGGDEGKLLRFLLFVLGFTLLFINLVNFNYKSYQMPYYYSSNVYLSDMMNKTDGIILDASPFPKQVFLTFVDNYDQRVVRDSLYFGYTQKSNQDIYCELKKNDVRYIVVLDSPEDNRVRFYGCPLSHIKRVRNFVEEYGTLYLADIQNFTWVYRIE